MTELIIPPPNTTKIQKESILYGEHNLDVQELITMQRPGANPEDVSRDQEKQIRLAIEARLCHRLGINEDVLKRLSTDQLISILQQGIDELKAIRNFSHVNAPIVRLMHQQLIPNINSTETPEPTVNDQKSKSTSFKRAQVKRETQTSITEALGQMNSIRTGILEPLSNLFLKLQGKNYSPHNVYGAYLGNEARTLTDSTVVRQEGDQKSSDLDLSELKKSELIEAFTVSCPEDFFRVMFKVLGLNKQNGFDSDKFFQRRTELLNAKYQPLKQSLKRVSAATINDLSENVIRTLRKELELRSQALHSKSDSGKKLHTKGVSSGFLSRLKQIWKDHDLNLDPRLVA